MRKDDPLIGMKQQMKEGWMAVEGAKAALLIHILRHTPDGARFYLGGDWHGALDDSEIWVLKEFLIDEALLKKELGIDLTKTMYEYCFRLTSKCKAMFIELLRNHPWIMVDFCFFGIEYSKHYLIYVVDNDSGAYLSSFDISPYISKILEKTHIGPNDDLAPFPLI
ncbi:MAG: hypothetical protein LUD17_08195 [Bacteroidales bacterium]|nr:hypothetical protein [Bacteroidales bacterium]